MRYDARHHEYHLRVLLHGAPLSGRRTNLAHLRDSLTHRRVRGRPRGPVDYVDIDLGGIHGHRVKARCLTLPIADKWTRLRAEVLRDLAGVVFVADSQRDQGVANLIAREELTDALQSAGHTLSSIPHVYQWNKRDVRHPIPVSVLERDLNPEGAESVSAISSSGIGVWRTWRRVVELVVEQRLGVDNG